MKPLTNKQKKSLAYLKRSAEKFLSHQDPYTIIKILSYAKNNNLNFNPFISPLSGQRSKWVNIIVALLDSDQIKVIEKISKTHWLLGINNEYNK